MISWESPKTIGNPHRFGARMKIGYLVLVFEKDSRMAHYPVFGNAFSISFFINVGNIRRIFVACWGYLPYKETKDRAGS